jgi:hypothetical protein
LYESIYCHSGKKSFDNFLLYIAFNKQLIVSSKLLPLLIAKLSIFKSYFLILSFNNEIQSILSIGLQPFSTISNNFFNSSFVLLNIHVSILFFIVILEF